MSRAPSKTTSRLITKIAGALFVIAALATPGARAGTLTVNFDAHTNAAPGCGIWSLTDSYGFLSSWTPTGPCAGPDMNVSNAGGSISGPAGAGQRVSIQTTAPSGITITGASVSGAQIGNINNGQGWGGGSFYSGGAGLWHSGESYETDSGIWSSYWGFAMICGWSHCTNGGAIYPNSITLTAVENQGPSMLAIGSNNLWYQSGHYVWNQAADPWSIALLAWDPSGVCGMAAVVGSSPVNGPSATPDSSVWQQCPNQYWDQAHGASVDTRSYVPTAGPLPLQLYAVNAAGVPAGVSETLQVDNDPVGVSLATPNDSNASAWVGHAVTVNAGARTGPSGLGGMNCSVDGTAARGYASPLTVDGDGVHTVSCTAWNRAVNPQGSPAIGASTEAIHIDEKPPFISLEAENPADPTGVVVDTSDSESGVAGGSIGIAPAGSSSWTSVPTSFDGRHLLAHVNDAGLRGSYTIRATSCDNVGNCATADESVTMPLRITAVSAVGFTRIVAPAKVVRERVRVGWHYKRVRHHGRLARIKVGGRYMIIRVVIRRNAACAHRRVPLGPHQWRELTACRAIRVRTHTTARVRHGAKLTVHGLLVTAQGTPMVGSSVMVLTAPVNGLGQFSPVGTVTTDSAGVWSAVLPAGPSRIIRAVYGGSATVLPAAGQAVVNVPARIVLSIRPRVVPWSGTITIRGHLDGGYVPADGVALRLLVRYPGSRRPSSLLALRTNSRGGFTIRWSYGAGYGSASYPFSIATTATETDYPWAAASSRPILVTFGLPTPTTTPRPGGPLPRHRRRHGRHHRRPRR